MSWIQGGWRKKAVFLGLLSLVSILLIRDRRGNFDQLEQLQTRLLTCTHYSDSLVSQLEVINRYKQTVEDLVGQQKNESRRAAESFELRIRELAIKNEHCQNQLGGCQRNDKTADRLVHLQTENAEQRTKIEQLEEGNPTVERENPRSGRTESQPVAPVGKEGRPGEHHE
ncbi:hypothetical protein M3Y99_00171500 [Aphelenchoides fujianensis]|nr:hypothetical protein M3Y99_00171500 [Aphelenchoides fujianensis]